MNNNKRPVYTVKNTVNLGGSYANKAPIQKRTISGPQKEEKKTFTDKMHKIITTLKESVQKLKRKISGPQRGNQKSFVDKSRKIIITLIAMGVVGLSILGTIGGTKLINYIGNEKAEAEIVALFENSLKETYENSEFLQTSLREDTYYKYCESIIEDSLEEEDSLMEFFDKNQNEIDRDAWLYILTGEGNRAKIEDEKLLTSLEEYKPYIGEITFDENGKPDKQVSYFAEFASADLNEENKKDFIAVLDAMVGTSSISNSKEAIKYGEKQIEEARMYIRPNEVKYLQSYINKNNNFEQNYDEDFQALQPYILKLYNPRVETAKDIKDGIVFRDVRDYDLLKKLTKKVAKHSVIKDAYANIRLNGRMYNDVATSDEYKIFRNTRNDLYKFCINGSSNQEKTAEKLNSYQSELDKKSELYNEYDKKSDKFLEEILILVEYKKELIQELEGVNENIKNTGFDDFSH